MSYLKRAQDPRRRATAISAVVAIHAVLGYALVTGLAFQVYEKVYDYRPTFDFKEAPEPPPPEADVVPEPSRTPDFVAPTPRIDLNDFTPVKPREFDPLVIPDPVVTKPVDPLIVPPRPQPSFTPRGARPRNDVSRWVLPEDYPSRELREGIEGVTGFRVVVGSDGRVDACEITASSGNARLDAATCRMVTRRARFDPASDGNGKEVVGSYSSTVRWQIPG